jgi:quercetin dioxygenase-like cupin family protein
MNASRKRVMVIVVGGLCVASLAAYLVNGSQAREDSHVQAKERARVVLSQPLGKLDGDHLRAILVEVNYGPGEASSPHSHPCPVIGYVVEGTLRSQVKGAPEKTYKAGESFYEESNGVHAVSANASSTEPAKLLAYFVCDHDTPLSVDVPESTGQKGASK